MSEILTVATMFLLRVGLPVVVLIILGILIERWQTRREAEIKKQYQSDINIKFKQSQEDAVSDDDQQAA